MRRTEQIPSGLDKTIHHFSAANSV